MYLTLKQCAELAENMNVSTARYYKDSYFEYFDTNGEGKTTKFEEHSTIELLKLIKSAYVKKLDHDQIVELLNVHRGFIPSNSVVQASDNNTEITQQEDLALNIRHILFEELAKQNRIILQLQDELEDMKAEFKEGLAGLYEKVENGHRDAESRDLEVMQKLNDIKLIQQQRNKPWWRKLFGK